MLDGLPWPEIGVGSGWLVVVIGVIYIMRGRLIPLAQVQRELDAAAKALERAEHDRDEWRAEGRLKDAQIAEKDRQLAHMGEVGRQVTRVLTALQQLPHAPEVD